MRTVSTIALVVGLGLVSGCLVARSTSDQTRSEIAALRMDGGQAKQEETAGACATYVDEAVTVNDLVAILVRLDRLVCDIRASLFGTLPIAIPEEGQHSADDTPFSNSTERL